MSYVLKMYLLYLWLFDPSRPNVPMPHVTPYLLGLKSEQSQMAVRKGEPHLMVSYEDISIF